MWSLRYRFDVDCTEDIVYLYGDGCEKGEVVYDYHDGDEYGSNESFVLYFIF